MAFLFSPSSSTVRSGAWLTLKTLDATDADNEVRLSWPGYRDQLEFISVAITPFYAVFPYRICS
jgi:hypothetical protein